MLQQGISQYLLCNNYKELKDTATPQHHRPTMPKIRNNYKELKGKMVKKHVLQRVRNNYKELKDPLNSIGQTSKPPYGNNYKELKGSTI